MRKETNIDKITANNAQTEMKVVEINPHIRFASKIKLYDSESVTMSYDCRFLYITKGSCTVTVGNRDYDLKNGDAALWSSGQPYFFSNASNCECYIINFDYTQTAADKDSAFMPIEAINFDKEKLVCAPYFTDETVLNEPVIRHFSDTMRANASSLCAEFNQKKIYFGELCGIKMKEIIFEMLREILFVSKSTSEMLDTILIYIKEHYRENITNEQLGKLVGYHSYYINKLMLEYVGTTLHQYLLNYRMENALKLLLDPDKSIADVATESGFRSFYYFSRYFKEKTGLSPAQYRKTRRSMI